VWQTKVKAHAQSSNYNSHWLDDSMCCSRRGTRIELRSMKLRWPALEPHGPAVCRFNRVREEEEWEHSCCRQIHFCQVWVFTLSSGRPIKQLKPENWAFRHLTLGTRQKRSVLHPTSFVSHCQEGSRRATPITYRAQRKRDKEHRK
jgi:hypothetical protein